MYYAKAAMILRDNLEGDNDRNNARQWIDTGRCPSEETISPEWGHGDYHPYVRDAWNTLNLDMRPY